MENEVSEGAWSLRMRGLGGHDKEFEFYPQCVRGLCVFCMRKTQDTIDHYGFSGKTVSEQEEKLGDCTNFLRAAGAKYHKISSSGNRNLLSLSSGGQKCEIKVLTGLIPSEDCEERGCSRPLSWLVDGCLFPGHFKYLFSIHVCLSKLPPFVKTPCL